jgi:hypothetical protein
MVGIQMTFGSPDYSTPHGGAPFTGWKKGFGFGHAKGAGGSVLDPSVPAQLRFTPNADRGLASSAFWRRKYELGQAAGFGIGDRPSYVDKNTDICPNTYGDVSPLVSKVRRNQIREGLKLKPRFPSIEEKLRDANTSMAGPGPAKYDTSYAAGQSSWTRPAKNPSFSIRPRGITASGDLKEMMGKPGPVYDVISKPGERSPIRHGTIYNIALRGRVEKHDVGGEASPGPAKYTVKGELDNYTLGAMISNAKTPHYKQILSPRMPGKGSTSMGASMAGSASASALASPSAQGAESYNAHGLTHVESSPAF